MTENVLQVGGVVLFACEAHQSFIIDVDTKRVDRGDGDVDAVDAEAAEEQPAKMEAAEEQPAKIDGAGCWLHTHRCANVVQCRGERGSQPSGPTLPM